MPSRSARYDDSLLQIRFGAAVFNFRNHDYAPFGGRFFAAGELSRGKIEFTDPPTGPGANLRPSVYI